MVLISLLSLKTVTDYCWIKNLDQIDASSPKLYDLFFHILDIVVGCYYLNLSSNFVFHFC